MSRRLVADREVCIGSGNCVLTDPDLFDQDDDGLVQPLVDQVDGAELDSAELAVQRCPSGALTLAD